MTTKTEAVYARLDQSTKTEAESIFKKLGISASTAIGMFYRQVIQERGLPFELKVKEEVPKLESIYDYTKEEFEQDLLRSLEDVKSGNYYTWEESKKMLEERIV